MLDCRSAAAFLCIACAACRCLALPTVITAFSMARPFTPPDHSWLANVHKRVHASGASKLHIRIRSHDGHWTCRRYIEARSAIQCAHVASLEPRQERQLWVSHAWGLPWAESAGLPSLHHLVSAAAYGSFACTRMPSRSPCRSKLPAAFFRAPPSGSQSHFP